MTDEIYIVKLHWISLKILVNQTCQRKESCLFIWFFFLSMFPFTNIHYSPDRMLRGRLTLILFSTISTRFTDTRFLDIRRVITAESRGDFAHGQKPDSNRKDLVSVRKSLACELRALQTFYKIDFMKVMLC